MTDQLQETVFLERETHCFTVRQQGLLSKEIADALRYVANSIERGHTWRLDSPGMGFMYTLPLTVKVEALVDYPSAKLRATASAPGVSVGEWQSTPYLEFERERECLT